MAALALPIAIVTAVYLAPFAVDRDRMPFGNDTAGYVWRIGVVRSLGVDRLPGIHARSLPDRPGHLVVASVVGSILGVDPFTQTWITPAALASVLALAVVAFAIAAARERDPLAASVGPIVAASPFVAWTAVGYASNLAFDPIAVAAAVAAAMLAAGRRGVVALLVLSVGGALVHWGFAIPMFGVLLTWAMLLAILRSRGERGAPRPGPRRWWIVGAIVLAGLGGTIAYLALTPQTPGRMPRTPPGAAERIAARVPSMALGVTIPLSAAGAAAGLARNRDRRRRASVGILAVWALAGALGVAAWYVAPVPVPPPYRTAPFALGIPACIGIGALATRAWMAERWRGVGAAAGNVLLLAVAAWLVAAGAFIWYRQPSGFTSAERAELASLSSYLAPLPDDARIGIVIPPSYGRKLPASRILAGLAPRRLASVKIRVATISGTTERARLNGSRAGADVLAVLEAFGHEPPPFGALIAPGVWVVKGPDPDGVVVGAPARAPGPLALVATVLGTIAILWVAGIGWCRGTLDVDPTSAVALAPALGLATLATIGTAASRLGVPLDGASAVGIVLACSAAGWLTYLARRRWGARSVD